MGPITATCIAIYFGMLVFFVIFTPIYAIEYRMPSLNKLIAFYFFWPIVIIILSCKGIKEILEENVTTNRKN